MQSDATLSINVGFGVIGMETHYFGDCVGRTTKQEAHEGDAVAQEDHRPTL